MSDLQGVPGELHFTVTVTRKETGKVETYEMVGRPADNELPEQPEENQP